MLALSWSSVIRGTDVSGYLDYLDVNKQTTSNLLHPPSSLPQQGPQMGALLFSVKIIEGEASQRGASSWVFELRSKIIYTPLSTRETILGGLIPVQTVITTFSHSVEEDRCQNYLCQKHLN